MYEKEIHRGDVWWVSVDDSVGREMQTGRPAVVISTDGATRFGDARVVAFLTTRNVANAASPQVVVRGRTNRVLCNHLRTVDARRFTEKMGTLNEEEMFRVSGALASVFGLKPPRMDTPVMNDNVNIELRVQCDLYKKLYENALEQLAEMKFEQVTKEPEPAVEEDQGDELVDINDCDIDELMRHGVTERVAREIVDNAPYRCVEDIRKLPSMTDIMFHLAERELCCIVDAEVLPEKVNINTATANEIHQKIGINANTASRIVGYRKKNGPFKCLEDLLDVPRFGMGCWDKYHEMFTIGEG